MDDYELLQACCRQYESKLIELMSEHAAKQFFESVAKEVFAESICRLPDGEFKEIALNNFDAITGSDEEFWRSLHNTAPDDSDDYDRGADY